MRLRAVLRTAALIPAVVFVLLAALILFVALTESGSRLALRMAASVAGEQLSIRSASGTLGERLVLNGVTVTTTAATVAIEHIEFAWDHRALFIGTLHINPLRVDGVTVELADSAPNEEPPVIEVPAAPLRVTVLAAEVSNLTVIDGAARTHLERVAFALRWRGQRLTLQDFALAMDALAARGELAADSSAGTRFSLALEIEAGSAEGPVAATVAVRGPLAALNFEASVRTPHVASLSGTLNALEASFDLVATLGPYVRSADGTEQFALSHIVLDSSGDANSVRFELGAHLAAAGSAPRAVQLSGALHGAQDLAAYSDHARFEFAWQATALAAAAPAAPLLGYGSGGIRDGALTITHRSAPPYASELSMSAAGLTTDTVFEAKLSVAGWTVILPQQAPITLDSARLELAGALDDFVLDGAAVVFEPRAGEVSANWRARYAAQRVNISTLSVAALDGSIDASANVSLTEPLVASAEFTARDLNLGRLRADLRSRIGLAGALEFTAAAAGPRATVDLRDISGRWRGQPLTGSAGLEIEPERVQVHDGQFTLGPNTLRLDLDLGAQLDGRFALAFSDFSALADGLEGALNARGEFGGTRRTPLIKAELEGRGLSFEQWSVNTLAATADINFVDTVHSTLALSASGLAQGAQQLGTLQLDARGAPRAHSLDLDLKGPLLTLQLAAHGALEQSSWRGTLDTLSFEQREAGRWALGAPAGARVEQGALTLEEACLAQAAARACISAAALAAQAGAARASISALPLAVANDFLPRTVRLSGTLDAELAVRHEQNLWLGDARLATSAAVITAETGAGEQQDIPMRAMQATLNMETDRFGLVAHGDVGDWFVLDARFNATREADRALDGSVSLRSRDIAWLGEFLPRVAGTRGGAALDLRLNGSLDDPAFDAALKLDEGHLYFPDVGLDINTLSLTARTTSGREIALHAALTAGEGTLEASGTVLNDAAAHWPAQLKIKGTDFAIVRLPEGEADISPDLKLVASAEHVAISGVLDIPRVAIIAPPAQASVVGVSPDEVIIRPTADGAPPDEDPGTPDFLVDAVTGDVEVRLGDAVTIDAAGLTARLSGGLHWRKQEGEILGRADGRLRIRDGAYSAYGQNLSISRGSLIFAGPVDNPALDLRAVRPDLDVTAGIAVSGSVRQPKIALFSQPAMSDSDILSYLITGRPLDDSSSGEAGLIAQAALGLGAEQSSIITSQIQNAFGLDEFSVNAGQSASNSSLVAGKRITPKLSVRADFNPFDRLWTIFLNYKLSKTLSVEAESGQSKGADLLYTHERNTLLPDFGGDKP